MNDEQKTWTLADTARASNPGNLRVNPLRWIRHYPIWPMIWCCSLAVFVALAFLFHWGFWVFAVLLLGMNWLYWQRIREHFRHGCANPAVVVSLDPMLIAVSTDLTKGVGHFPVIKIIEASLSTACGQVPQIGTRLPTVALYRMSPDESLPHWVNFDPRPIDTVTGDLNKMQAMMNTFTQEDWNELMSWLRQVPRPFTPGLYPIQTNE